MPKHSLECVNNTNNLKRPVQKQANTVNTLDRNGIYTSTPKTQDEVNVRKRYSDHEASLAFKQLQNGSNDNSRRSLDEIKTSLYQHSLALQKINYTQTIISEWKKNIDLQISQIKSTFKPSTNNEYEKQFKAIQEKLLQVDHFKMDLNILKESVYKENTHFKKTEMDFARNIQDLSNVLKDNNNSMAHMWNDNINMLNKVNLDIDNTRLALDEQKAKTASLVFDLRAVNQIASEAAEKIEIQEREMTSLIQEVNQVKLDIEILEGLVSSYDSNSGCCKRLLWRITEVESKLARAKENDIVLRSPVFYTHQYGYKIRVLLYLNGLNKWKDRYALACLHVLKGEYDMLLPWPCSIEGTVTLRDLSNISQPKNFMKYIKTKKRQGDEDEDEPQESNSTYIFIPHSTLLKGNYIKEDSLFLDININEDNKYETAI